MKNLILLVVLIVVYMSTEPAKAEQIDACGRTLTIATKEISKRIVCANPDYEGRGYAVIQTLTKEGSEIEFLNITTEEFLSKYKKHNNKEM